MERFPTFLFCPLKNYVVESYLSIELVILQKCIGHLSPTRGIIQSHIPYDHNANQAIRENLVEQRTIVSIRCHLPIEHAQLGVRISSAIILDELRQLELGRHND